MRSFSVISMADQSSGSRTLKITPKGFAWKELEGSGNVTVDEMDLLQVEWLRGARGKQL